MPLKNESLFDKGDTCSIYEETLSDVSLVYNIRIYEPGDKSKHVELQARDLEHAIKIFDVLNEV